MKTVASVKKPATTSSTSICKVGNSAKEANKRDIEQGEEEKMGVRSETMHNNGIRSGLIMYRRIGGAFNIVKATIIL